MLNGIHIRRKYEIHIFIRYDIGYFIQYSVQFMFISVDGKGKTHTFTGRYRGQLIL